MIRLLSSFIYCAYSLFDCSFLHTFIMIGAAGYSDIYVSDIVVIRSQVGVFKKLRKVATRFYRQ